MKVTQNFVNGVLHDNWSETAKISGLGMWRLGPSSYLFNRSYGREPGSAMVSPCIERPRPDLANLHLFRRIMVCRLLPRGA